jgi:hypothetical protein
MHWYNWLDFKHVLDSAEGTNVKAGVVLKRNTDKICFCGNDSPLVHPGHTLGSTAAIAIA